MCKAKTVAYFRVSTAGQGASGLGLEAQQEAIRRYLATVPGSKVLTEYTEIESGKNSDRPELAKALAHARSARATLVVAKLDRLARNLHFLSSLMEAGVDFVACDNPHANRLTIHILAAVAEDEARRISERTKAALAAAKARGKLLGSARPGHWAGREDRRLAGARKGAQRAATERRRLAQEGNALVLEIIRAERAGGTTWQRIADRLNAEGHVTRRGKPWSAASVCQIGNGEVRAACPREILNGRTI